MVSRKNLFRQIVWYVYIFYLFSIMVFGDRAEYYKYSNIAFVVFVAMMLTYIGSTSCFCIHYKDLMMFPFVVFSFISSIWSYDKAASISRSVTLLQLFVLCVVLAVYLYRTGECKEYLLGFAVAGLITTIYVVGYYGIPQLRYLMSNSARIGGEIVNENTLAIFIAISVSIFLLYFFETKKMICLILCLPLVVIIALTGSKKGLLDVVVGAVISVIFSSADQTNDRIKKFLKVLFTLLIMGIVFYFVWKLPLFDTVRDRLTRMLQVLGGASANTDYSTNQRQIMLEEGIKQFIKTPVLGIGIGASGYITSGIVGFASYLHNNYIELLATVGLIGTFLYYLPIVKTIKSIWINGKNDIEGKILIVLLVIVLVNDLAAVQYFSKITYITIGIAIAYFNAINDNYIESL